MPVLIVVDAMVRFWKVGLRWRVMCGGETEMEKICSGKNLKGHMDLRQLLATL
jgi:hypothetical protein